MDVGREDSEILWVGNNKVIYRVNDTIYEARITAKQIQDRTVIVKDKDFPENHWVFWAQ